MSRESRILYHYTNEISLGPIVRSQMIDVTGSNVNNIPVVWLTGNPKPDDLGVGVPGGMPPELDKTRYRFTSNGSRTLRSGPNGVKRITCRRR